MPSFSELIFILVLALVLIGPKQLPEVARNIARFINQMKRASEGMMADIRNEATKVNDDIGVKAVKDGVDQMKSSLSPFDLKPYKGTRQEINQEIAKVTEAVKTDSVKETSSEKKDS